MTLARDGVASWIAAYERLWRTPGTGALGELFTDDASYSMGPYHDSAHGLAAIAELWERERAGADEPFEMTTEVVAVDGDVAVVRVEVQYRRPPHEYRDLWVIRFAPDGRCAAFEEWPFWPANQRPTA